MSVLHSRENPIWRTTGVSINDFRDIDAPATAVPDLNSTSMVLKRKRGNPCVAVDPSPPSAESSPQASWSSSQPAAARKRPRRALDGVAASSTQEPLHVETTTWTPVVMPSPPSAAARPLSAPPKTRSKAAPKRGKKKINPNDTSSDPEKRGARFRVRCPKNILDRLERVRTQTFFMVDRKRNEGELREEFSVLGSTGNVYKIAVDKFPSCNCPDARKGNHCKHILFVMTKVLQVPEDTGLWYQSALLISELETIFASAPAAPNAVTNRRVQEAYARATGQAPSTATFSKKRIPEKDDDCPICYETMYQIAEAKLVFCDECGNALHTECFNQWRATSSRSGKGLTCVWCRSKWTVCDASAGPARKGTYLNLAGAAGLSPVRDTSSYYRGWRGNPYVDDD